MRKKIMILGGGRFQCELEMVAKKLNYHTYCCDWLESAPISDLADKFFLTSISEKDCILELMSEHKINFITSSSSDIGMSSASWISSNLGLPGINFSLCQNFFDKSKFIKILEELGLNTRFYKVYDANADLDLMQSSITKDLAKLLEIGQKLFVKPTDASGGKGISIIKNNKSGFGLPDAINFALLNSQDKKIIVESEIENIEFQICGDGYYSDGSVRFAFYGQGLYSQHRHTAIAEVFGLQKIKMFEDKLNYYIESIFKHVGIERCCFNLDALVTNSGDFHFIELSPRLGGNFIANVAFSATGVNLYQAQLTLAAGEVPEIEERLFKEPGYWVNLLLTKEIEKLLPEIKKIHGLSSINSAFSPINQTVLWPETTQNDLFENGGGYTGRILLYCSQPDTFYKLMKLIESCFNLRESIR